MNEFINRIKRKINYVLSCRSSVVDIQDLMMRNEWGYSGIQYIVISRVYDINAYRNDNKFIWHTELNELDNGRLLNKTQRRDMDLCFKEFIEKIDVEDLNLKKHPLICSKNPISLLDGTHRLAYCILNGENVFIPLELRNDDIYFPLNGEH